MTRRTFVLLAASALAGVSAAHAESWKLQYFYDEDKTELAISDLKFSSPRRGVAVGAIKSYGRSARPTALVTSDGGEHWALVPTKDQGVSLFLLNDSLGWMTTPEGIWRTSEGGRNWEKLGRSPKGALRVWFLNEQRGFAVGMRKGVFETRDGGRTWTPVQAAAKAQSKPENTSYTWISFADQRNGMIAGWSLPPRHGDDSRPAWIEPDAAIRRSELPHLGFLLQTTDGGDTWNFSATSMLGRVTRIRFGPKLFGIWLIEFGESFPYAAEVYRSDNRMNKLERTYRSRDRAITDAWITGSGTGYLAGIELLGQLRQAYVPGKLKMMRSDDLVKWTEMEVDYRASASRAVIAAADERNVWVATDTGMILKLVP